MHGDGMLFVREDAVEAAEAVVEPMLGNASPVHRYEPGSWGPVEPITMQPIWAAGIIPRGQLSELRSGVIRDA